MDGGAGIAGTESGVSTGGTAVGCAGPGETGGANGDSNVFGRVGNCGCSEGRWAGGGIQVEGGANGESVLGGAEAGAAGPADSEAGAAPSWGSPSSSGVRGGVMRRGAAGQGG